jgi:hypothetical protein
MLVVVKETFDSLLLFKVNLFRSEQDLPGTERGGGKGGGEG